MADVDPSLCKEALDIVGGSRQAAYGAPERNFARIAKAWEALTDRPYTEAEVALMMVALKVVREAHQHQRDNIVDLIGYGLLAEALLPAPGHPISNEMIHADGTRHPYTPGEVYTACDWCRREAIRDQLRFQQANCPPGRDRC